MHARALASEARASGCYVAAQTGGAGRWYLVHAHLLPLVAPPVARHALTRLPSVALGFLGIGAGPGATGVGPRAGAPPPPQNRL